MQQIKKSEFFSPGMPSIQQMPSDPVTKANTQSFLMKREPDPLDSSVLIKPLKKVKISSANEDSESFEDDSDINESDYETLLNQQIESQKPSIPSFSNTNKPRYVTKSFFGECAINSPLMIIQAPKLTAKRPPRAKAKPSASDPIKKKTKKTGWTSPHSELVDLGPKMKLPAPDLDPTNEKDFVAVLDPNYGLRGNFAVLRFGNFASKIFGKSFAIMSLRTKEDLMRDDEKDIGEEYEEIQRNYEYRAAYLPRREELLKEMGVIM